MAKRIVNRVVVKRSPMIMRTTPKEAQELHIPKWVLYFLVFGLLIVVVWYAIFETDYFTVKQTEISGGVSVEARKVVEELKGKNIFFVKTEELKEEIKRVYPEASSVAVYRGLPDLIKVEVKTRKAMLVWQVGGKKYLVDSRGVVFKEAVDENKTMPIVEDGKGLSVELGKKIITMRLINFINYFDLKFNNNDVTIEKWVVGDTSLSVDGITNKGWKIMFDASRNPKWQMEDLEAILVKHKDDVKQYLDLRVPGFGYYK